MENMYYVQSEESKVNQRKRISKPNKASSYGYRNRGGGVLASRRYEKGVSVEAGGTGVVRS